MAITLNRFATGDTNYVSKMNTNATIIEAAVNNLQLQVGTLGGGGGGGNGGLDEIYDRSGIIGISSWEPTLISDTDLSFTSGSIWMLNTRTRVQTVLDQSITFVGKAVDTYFINVDAAGTVTASTVAILDGVAIYTVDWTDPDFDNITVNSPYLFYGDDYNRMLSSDTLGVFTLVADRLSAMEAAGLGGATTSFVDGFAKSGATENLSGNIGTTDFHLSSDNFSGAFKRGLVYWLEISSTLEPASLYDIELYISDIDAGTPEVSQLVFQVLSLDGGDSPYVTRFPFFVRSETGSDDHYLRISNNGASAALFTYNWKAEKFT